MKRRIAIEPNLTPIKDFLSDKGFSVENINYGGASMKQGSAYDAYIITGLDSNFLGIHDTNSKAVVIDAKGLTPEQVYQELKSRID